MIKEIEKIPDVYQTKSRRQMLYEDIKDAWESGVQKFEFTGYDDWKYIGNYAREEAQHYVQRQLVIPEYKRIWKETYPNLVYPLYRFSAWKDFCQISTRRIDGKIHCYCVFSHMGDDFEPYLRKMIEKDHEQKIARDKEIEEMQRKREAKK